MNIQQAIARLVAGANLTEREMVDVMDQVMTGEATPIQVGAFLTALRIQGETVAEVTGAARVMREKAVHVDAGEGCVLDTCWHRRRREEHLQHFPRRSPSWRRQRA